MIFVCVGSTNFSFDRLLQMVDELCDDGILPKDGIFAQLGKTSYQPRNYKYKGIISRGSFLKYIRESDLIITHGGTGCIIPALKLEKKVIIVPRLHKYHEQIDDHQMEIMNFCTNQGYALGASTKEDLAETILNLDKFIPRKFVSNNDKINKMIIDYIEAN
ncbi:MAG: capsular biosynthesis protein CpsG [Lachnospiraceae bacterium]|nr:capsular biosynthesis protein CpsG [Lachnospiraceae bacterium]